MQSLIIIVINCNNVNVKFYFSWNGHVSLNTSIYLEKLDHSV